MRSVSDLICRWLSINFTDELGKMNRKNKIIFIVGCLLFFTVGCAATPTQDKAARDTGKQVVSFQENIKFGCKLDLAKISDGVNPSYVMEKNKFERFTIDLNNDLNQFLLKKPIDFVVSHLSSTLSSYNEINKIFLHQQLSWVNNSIPPKIIINKFEIIENKSDSREFGYIIARVTYKKEWNWKAGSRNDTPISASAMASYLVRIDYTESGNIFNGNITIFDAKNEDATFWGKTAAETQLDFSAINGISKKIEKRVYDYSIQKGMTFSQAVRDDIRSKIANSLSSKGAMSTTKEYIYNTSCDVAKSRMDRNIETGIVIDSGFRMRKEASDTFLVSGTLHGERETQVDFLIKAKLYPESKNRVAVKYDATLTNTFYDRESKKEILGKQRLSELLTKTTKAIADVVAEK